MDICKRPDASGDGFLEPIVEFSDDAMVGKSPEGTIQSPNKGAGRGRSAARRRKWSASRSRS
jgi:hypothetical protein